MLSKKAKTTKRKFYGKWLYKISLQTGGAAMFRQYSPELFKEFAQTLESQHHAYSSNRRCWPFRHTLLNISLFLEEYDKSAWAKRVEHQQIDFYTNDKTFYEEMSGTFAHLLLHRFAPAEGAEHLLDKASTIVVKDLPHAKYRHRVYLLPHKLKDDKVSKKKFLDWMQLQDPRILCTPAAKKWFLETDYNWDRRYVLVEDEATLLMLKLRAGNVMGRVYNFEVSDK